MHLDHGKNMEVVKRAIKLGFDSVMIDGSTLPYKENVKLTKANTSEILEEYIIEGDNDEQ